MRLGVITLSPVLSACISTESEAHSYNGQTVDVELYGDAFAFGSPEQQQAQLDAARAKAAEVCGRPAEFLSRRMDEQPQNGYYYAEARNIALSQCK